MSTLGVVGGTIGAARSLDLNWAIYNTAHLLTALCHLAGLATAERPRVPSDQRAPWLAATYGGGLAAVGLAAWAASAGRMPTFHVPGHGGTLLRTLVVGTTVVLFTLAASLLWQTHRRTRSDFFRWYALGLGLLATGLAGSMLIAAGDSPLQWLTRSTRAWGTVYLVVAVLAGHGAGGNRALPLAAMAPAWRERMASANLDRSALVRVLLRYGSAPAAVAASMAMRLAAITWCGPGLPMYITFFPGVMAVSVLAGFGPGLLATALTALCVNLWFLAPAGQLLARTPSDRLGLAIFIAMGVFMGMVARLYRSTRDKAAAYDREAARRESETKYQNLFRNMTEEVHVWKLVRDADGEILTWRLEDANPPALATWGRSLDGIAGLTADEIFGPGSTLHYLPVVRKIMAEGVPFAYEDYFPNLDRHFRFTSVPHGDGFITTGADITALKHVQEKLQEEGRRKDDFLALLGHELRNPLAPIGYAVHLLRSPGREPGLLDSACAIIERQVAHMSRLVDDLLNISRITHGKIQLRLEPVDLEEIVRVVVEDYEHILREHELALETACAGLPLPLEADRARIVQSVSNLIQNAVKFTPPGGRIRVAVGPGQAGWGRVQVRDTGCGIAPDLMDSLFQPFRQGPGTRTGLGLGLALVKGLVGMHGGRVTVRSDGAGFGSEFTLELPLAGNGSRAEVPRPPDPSGPQGGPRRILVIEDMADSAFTLQALLQRLGHTVAVAQDGPAGLHLADRFRPDLVLCDIGLPGDLDGHEVARILRSTPGGERIRLVALTGFGTPEDKEKATRAGFDAHLTKPVDPADLGSLIAGLTAGGEAGQEPEPVTPAPGRAS
jgi:signal transduction histidine kinase/CheY-like chemotaxis protein